jgi:Ca2+-binding EF-hand superfamily protein
VRRFAFSVFDTDASGKIADEELKELLKILHGSNYDVVGAAAAAAAVLIQ